MSPEEKFNKICESLNQVEDATMKNAIATSFFGTSGTKLIPLLNDMSSLRDEAKSLGVVMSTSMSKNAAALNDSFGRIGFTTRSLMHSIANALAPSITDLLNKTAGMISTVKKWVSENQDLVLTVGKAVGIFAILASGLVAVGSAVSLLGVGLGGIASILGIVGSVLGVILSPIGLLVAGISAASYAFLTMTDAGQSLVNFFVGQFLNLYNICAPVINSIISAFKMGDLSTGFAITMAALKVPALQLWGWMKSVFNEGVFYLSSLWDEISFGALKAWAMIQSGCSWDFLVLSLNEVGRFLSNTFLTIINGIVDMFGWMVNKIASSLYALNIISDKTLVSVNRTVRDISKSIGDLKDDNNKFYDQQITERSKKIDESPSGQQLRKLEAEKQDSINQRAQNLVDTKTESDDAVAKAIAELNDLVAKQNEIEKNATTVKDVPVTPLQKAIAINPSKIKEDMKTDVGSTVAFNSRIASIMALSAKDKVAYKQLDVLKQIAENTEEDNIAVIADG